MPFPLFGDAGQAAAGSPCRTRAREGVSALRVLREGAYARTWALAQRLRRRAETQEDFVQAVLRHLKGEDFAYTESPSPAAENLEGFLFDAKSGYCQQYSGAMALLLRMGGVPARVSTGFTTGALDRKAGEYVVRDLDAHSWVEVWYSGFGWVTMDPTPSAAPARSQADEAEDGRGAARCAGRRTSAATSARTSAAATRRRAGGTPWTLIGLGAAAAARGWPASRCGWPAATAAASPRAGGRSPSSSARWSGPAARPVRPPR